MTEGEIEEEQEPPEIEVPAIFDITLYDSAGALLDDKAKAHELNPSGFQAETKLKLREGSKIDFMVHLDTGESVGGQALITWVKPDQWGWYIAGAKITKMPWRHKRKLGRQGRTPYDFFELAKLTVKAAYAIVLVAAVQNIILYQPHLVSLFVAMLPVLGAMLVLAFAFLLLRKKG